MISLLAGALSSPKIETFGVATGSSAENDTLGRDADVHEMARAASDAITLAATGSSEEVDTPGRALKSEEGKCCKRAAKNKRKKLQFRQKWKECEEASAPTECPDTGECAISCAAGTTTNADGTGCDLDGSSAVLKSDVTCAAGTTPNAGGSGCEPDVSCAAGTTPNADGTGCVLDESSAVLKVDVSCAAGTTHNADRTGCEAVKTCEEGTVALPTQCVDDATCAAVLAGDGETWRRHCREGDTWLDICHGEWTVDNARDAKCGLISGDLSLDATEATVELPDLRFISACISGKIVTVGGTGYDMYGPGYDMYGRPIESSESTPTLKSLSMPALESVGGGIFVCGSGYDMYGQPIESSESPSELESLSMPALESVGGGISVKNDSKLVMPVLESVGGDIYIKGNVGLECMPALKSVAGGIIIHDNVELESLSMPAMKSVGGDLNVRNNTNLESLSMPALESVGGTISGGISLKGNAKLESLEAPVLQSLGSLSVGGDGYTDNDLGNPQLASITMPKLEIVHGDVRVRNNAKLASLSVPMLTTIGNCATTCNRGDVVVTKNNELASISMPKLEAGYWFLFKYNEQLTSIDFPSLARARSFRVEYNGRTDAYGASRRPEGERGLASISAPMLTTAGVSYFSCLSGNCEFSNKCDDPCATTCDLGEFSCADPTAQQG